MESRKPAQSELTELQLEAREKLWLRISENISQQDSDGSRFRRYFEIAYYDLCDMRGKADELFDEADQETEFQELFDTRLSVIAAIDIAVKGESNFKAKPAFTLQQKAS